MVLRDRVLPNGICFAEKVDKQAAVLQYVVCSESDVFMKNGMMVANGDLKR